MSAHTPGPWKVEGGQQSWSVQKGTIEYVLGRGGLDGDSANEGDVVATLITGAGKMDNAANRALIKADAKVIAAAPTMLELLRALVPFAESRAEDMLEIADPKNGSLDPDVRADALKRAQDVALLVEKAKDLLAEVAS